MLVAGAAAACSPPNGVAFSDDFETGKDGWIDAPGNTPSTNEVHLGSTMLKLTANSTAEAATWLPAMTSGDLIIQTRFAMSGTNERHGGIIFFSNTTTGLRGVGMAGYVVDYYVAGSSSQFRFYAHPNGGACSQTINNVVFSATPTFKVEVTGSVIRAYLDGVEKASCNDAGPRSGYFGLWSNTNDYMWFDDVSIACACTPTTFYQDSDGDSYGNPSVSQQACSAPNGYVSDNTDCNDASAAVKPTATEVCDGIDNNCNNQVDEGVMTTFYQDSDGDSYGNSSVSQQACSAPNGYVSYNTDCNDASAAVKPTATEVCDGIDNNCNAQTDESLGSCVGEAVLNASVLGGTTFLVNDTNNQNAYEVEVPAVVRNPSGCSLATPQISIQRVVVTPAPPSGVVVMSGFVQFVLDPCFTFASNQVTKIKKLAGAKRQATDCIAKYDSATNTYACVPECAPGDSFSCITDPSGVYVQVNSASALPCSGTANALAPVTDAARPALVLAGSGFNTTNKLTLHVKSKHYDSRVSRTFKLATNASCVPEVDFAPIIAADGSNGCYITYQAVYDFATLRDSCNVVPVNNLNETVSFPYILTVTETDNFFVRGSVVPRVTSTQLQLMLQFPTTQTLILTPNVILFADVVVSSVVTLSSFDRSTNAMTIKVFSSVQAPFNLALNSGSGSWTSLSNVTATRTSLNGVSGGAVCTTGSTSPCTYETTSVMTLTGCVFGGTLTFTLQAGCHLSNTDNCPDLASINPVTITVTVPYSDLCTVPVVIPQNSLAMTLATCADSGCAVTKSGFFRTQTIFVKATIKSSAVDIISSSVVDVSTQLQGAASPVVLVSNGVSAGLASYTPVAPFVNSSAFGIIQFSFIPNSALYPVPADSSKTLTITVKANVTYSNGKRGVLVARADASSPISSAVAVDLTALDFGSQPDDSSVAAVSSASTLVASFLCCTLLVAMIF